MLGDAALVIFEEGFSPELYRVIFNIDPGSAIGAMLNYELYGGLGHAHTRLMR